MYSSRSFLVGSWLLAVGLKVSIAFGGPPSTGACCLYNGNCVETIQDDCNAPNTTWLGPDTVCAVDSCSGFCFFPFQVSPGEPCSILGGVVHCLGGWSPESCEQNGGTFARGTTCSSVSGACCTDVGCLDTLQGLCDNAGGRWRAGQNCSDGPCGGACCVFGSACIDNVFGESLLKCACDSVFWGNFQGDSTSCDQPGIGCPQSTGACCNLLSAASPPGCVDSATEFACAYVNGHFQGNGTTCAESICRANPCPGIEPCCQIHRSPGCSDAQCCARICSIDPRCCFATPIADSPEWGPICVKLASLYCGDGAPYCPVPQDFNGDLKVDLCDYAVFQRTFGKP